MSENPITSTMKLRTGLVHVRPYEKGVEDGFVTTPFMRNAVRRDKNGDVIREEVPAGKIDFKQIIPYVDLPTGRRELARNDFVVGLPDGTRMVLREHEIHALFEPEEGSEVLKEAEKPAEPEPETPAEPTEPFAEVPEPPKEVDETSSPGEIDQAQAAEAEQKAEEPEEAPKRGPGRPRGSRNKS